MRVPGTIPLCVLNVLALWACTGRHRWPGTTLSMKLLSAHLNCPADRSSGCPALPCALLVLAPLWVGMRPRNACGVAHWGCCCLWRSGSRLEGLARQQQPQCGCHRAQCARGAVDRTGSPRAPIWLAPLGGLRHGVRRHGLDVPRERSLESGRFAHAVLVFYAIYILVLEECSRRTSAHPLRATRMAAQATVMCVAATVC